MAEQFTGRKGKYVKVADTVRSFKEVVEGKHDEIPEQAFYMQGAIEDVLEAWEDMKKKARVRMADTFQIEIATPEKLPDGRTGRVRARFPGKDGYMGILPGHAALLAELGEGLLIDHLQRQYAEVIQSTAATSKFATITCACWRIAPSSSGYFNLQRAIVPSSLPKRARDPSEEKAAQLT